TLTAWSPTDETIVFYSNRSGNWDLWAADLSGTTEPRQVTDLPGAELYPTFSPDGSMVVFRSEQDGNGDLWVVSPDGARLQPWIDDEFDSGWGAWSPDARFFYYSSNRGGDYNIWMRDPAGGAPTAVTRYSGPALGLSESPLYTRFAVGGDRLVVPVETRRSELWLLEWTGGAEEPS
ncbi:MAG: hypothetical protein R3344_15485, partial [Acidobacteriota bacterium]|nr:hypothetical protein [Acidobacteriota bacterium]